MKGFTKIPNDLIRNGNISAGAFRLWCVVAAQQPGKPFTREFACNLLGCSRPTFYQWRNELIDAGLLIVVEVPGHPTKLAVVDGEKVEENEPERGSKNFTPSDDKGGKKTLPTPGKKTLPGGGKKTLPQENTNIEKTKEEKTMMMMETPSPSPEKFDNEALKNFHFYSLSNLIQREQFCKLFNIDSDTYLRLVNEIITEWRATMMPPDRINVQHLLNHMRVKVRELNRSRPDRAAASDDETRKALLSSTAGIINLINKDNETTQQPT